MYTERKNCLQEKMAQHQIQQMITTDPASIFYYTEKWFHPGERLVALLTGLKGQHILIINELFPAPEELGAEKIWYRDEQDSVQILAQLIVGKGKVGIDKSWPSGFLLRLIALLPEVAFVNGSPLTDSLRSIKSQQEIQWMQEASSLNDLAMEKILKQIQGSFSEKKLAQQLLEIYEQLGTEGPSFPPIIAYGANGADPHHEGDHTLLKPGDSIILDIGCKKHSYCSDMTRTVFYQKVSDQAREVYHIVLEANLRAIDAIKPGVSFSQIDGAARDYIAQKGYGQYFTHRTGHSIGIDVHDFGDVSAVNHAPVQSGMIFSIEPGIYLPNQLGIRIEDLVLVTETGCQVLNRYSKELQVIG